MSFFPSFNFSIGTPNSFLSISIYTSVRPSIHISLLSATIPGLEPESPRSRPQGLVFGRSSLPPSIFPGLLVQNARAPDRTLFYCTRWRELGKHLAPCLGRSVHSSLPPSIFPGLLVQNARAPDRTLFYCTRWRELGKHLAPWLGRSVHSATSPARIGRKWRKCRFKKKKKKNVKKFVHRSWHTSLLLYLCPLLLLLLLL